MTDYVTLEELKSFMSVPDTMDDTVLELAISSASAVVDTHCGRVFGWQWPLADPPVAEDIPAGVKYACLLQASRFVVRRDSPFGVAGSAELGSELRLMAKVDVDVAVLLRPFVVSWGAF